MRIGGTVPALGLLAVVAIAAGCAGTGPSVTRPSPTASPTRIEGPTASPKGAPLIRARSCDPSIVSTASAAPSHEISPPRRFALHVPILMYHRIIPLELAPGSMPALVVAPAQFDAQLRALQAAGWHTITLAALAADLDTGVEPKPGTFVITIDDGRYDGYTYALPILRSHGFVATYFVVAGRIGHPDNMSAEDLVALTRSGMEVANHTTDHLPLTARSAATLTSQIDTAEATLAGVTGRWPVSFSYPRGASDAAVVAAVRACTQIRIAVEDRGSSPGKLVDRYSVPRINVAPGRTPAALLAEVDRYRTRP